MVQRRITAKDVIKELLGGAGDSTPPLSLVPPAGSFAGPTDHPLTNPMDGPGQMLRGGTGGALVKIAAGTDGDVLTMVSGLPAWAVGAGGLTTEQIQDMISTFLVAGAGMTITYNDIANTLELAVTAVPAGGKYRLYSLIPDPDSDSFLIVNDGLGNPVYTLEDLE
jgi:hypothetical protein